MRDAVRSGCCWISRAPVKSHGGHHHQPQGPFAGMLHNNDCILDISICKSIRGRGWSGAQQLIDECLCEQQRMTEG